MSAELLERATRLLEARRFELAIQSATHACADEAGRAEAFYIMSLCLSHMNRFDEARQAAREGLKIEPNVASLHYALGVASYLHIRHEQKSRRSPLVYIPDLQMHVKSVGHAMKRAVTLDPINPEYHALLGWAYLTARRDRWAEASFEQALRLDPNHVWSLTMLGDIRRRSDRLPEAMQHTLHALSVDPMYEGSHILMGYMQLEKGDAVAAIDTFRESLRLQPEDAYARAGLIEAIKRTHPFIGIPYSAIRWLVRPRMWRLVIHGVALVFAALVLAVGFYGTAMERDIKLLMGILLAGVVSSWAIALYNKLGMAVLYALTSMCNVVLLTNTLGRLALTPWQRYRSVVLCCLTIMIPAILIGLVATEAGLSGESLDWVMGPALLAGPLGAWAACLGTRWWQAGTAVLACDVVFVAAFCTGVVSLASPVDRIVILAALLLGHAWGIFVPSRL